MFALFYFEMFAVFYFDVFAKFATKNIHTQYTGEEGFIFILRCLVRHDVYGKYVDMNNKKTLKVSKITHINVFYGRLLGNIIRSARLSRNISPCQ
jgi:hypothetical protein